MPGRFVLFVGDRIARNTDFGPTGHRQCAGAHRQLAREIEHVPVAHHRNVVGRRGSRRGEAAEVHVVVFLAQFGVDASTEDSVARELAAIRPAGVRIAPL